MQAHASTSKDESRSRFTTSNNTVERRGGALPSIEVVLSQSSAPSLASPAQLVLFGR
jgi:hypothetical protein